MSPLVFVYALWHTVFVKQDVHNIIQRLTISVFFDILELDEDEDFSRMSTDPVLAYDDYRRKEKRLECRSLSATFRSIATGSPSSQFRQRRHFTRRN
jgi:hypothetical protein